MRLINQKNNELGKENMIILTYKEAQYLEACIGCATAENVNDYLIRHAKSAATSDLKVADELGQLYDEIIAIVKNFLKEDK